MKVCFSSVEFPYCESMKHCLKSFGFSLLHEGDVRLIHLCFRTMGEIEGIWWGKEDDRKLTARI